MYLLVWFFSSHLCLVLHFCFSLTPPASPWTVQSFAHGSRLSKAVAWAHAEKKRDKRRMRAGLIWPLIHSSYGVWGILQSSTSPQEQGATGSNLCVVFSNWYPRDSVSDCLFPLCLSLVEMLDNVRWCSLHLSSNKQPSYIRATCCYKTGRNVLFSAPAFIITP